ncbi:chemotaxis protein CheB [Ideonella sp. YS5]|uniref:chemotaxis protein CheB n=1 Tax=Ideonella sp. YS5 TaxID=3453714 RepID=UPI003EEB1595
MAELDPATGLPASLDEPQSAPAATRATHDIIVIGASAGGLTALKRLVSRLPPDYPGSMFVVVHISPEASGDMAAILARAGPVRAVAAQDGLAIEPGTLYTAPPDHHLLLEVGRMRVVRGPRENRHRPAVDPLFRSAAWAYGPRVVGVVLSGHLDDGTAGLWAVKNGGGITVVQDPGEAEHPEMPANALMHNRVDHRLPLADIADLLARLARQPVERDAPAEPVPGLGEEVGFAAFQGHMGDVARLGARSPFTCPSCRGALWELEEGGHLRYRCHTGHAFSQGSLLVDQTLAIEEGLYSALRAVEEKAAALRRLAERWPESISGVKPDYARRAAELDGTADVLRTLLAGGEK